MSDTPDRTDVSRRSVLKRGAVASSAALLGGTVLTGTAAADRRNLESWISTDGRWASWPDDPSLWRRSTNPYDFHEADGDGRWLAKPTRGGGVRCRIENDGGGRVLGEPLGNTGFYVGIGEIGDVSSITIDSESVHSAGSGPAELGVALFFDLSGNGDYFAWERIDGNTEKNAGLGGDAEGIAFGFPSDGQLVIDDGTGMTHISASLISSVTFGDYTAGDVGAVATDTDTALQVSVMGGGDDTVEEVIVTDIHVERS